jgi:hypothetical protein
VKKQKLEKKVGWKTHHPYRDTSQRPRLTLFSGGGYEQSTQPTWSWSLNRKSEREREKKIAKENKQGIS